MVIYGSTPRVRLPLCGGLNIGGSWRSVGVTRRGGGCFYMGLEGALWMNVEHNDHFEAI